ncbi:dsRBD fold-containing protein [Nonomuraea fuscirosea]|uniref:dsRBD fold-containing protein n=1 Tax=Nonomuraea fuscirosea TaxID=1291556 RepID=UPI003722BB9E
MSAFRAGSSPLEEGGVVMETKEWAVRIELAEDGDDTTARATLTAPAGHDTTETGHDTAVAGRDGAEAGRATAEAGRALTGVGRARRNPADARVAGIGDELAVSRALADLAEQLAVITNRDIAESSAESPAPSRSW